VAAEATVALAVRGRDAAGLKAALIGAGYLPADRADTVDAELALRMMRGATRWYAVPGQRRFPTDRSVGGRHREPAEEDRRAEIREQINQFAIPAGAVLIRRMHGVVQIVLTQLRAGADWGAIAAEYLHGEPPATMLGVAEAAFIGERR
jgi:hypothetical protein